MTPRLRRVVGIVAVPTLALGALTGLTGLPAASARAAETDPAPVAAGAAWLESQLTDGLVHNEQFRFDDYGLSIDAAVALAAVGGHDGAVQAVADAVAPNLDLYLGYDYVPAPAEGQGRHVIAGSIAKALVFAQNADRDPRAFGGHDLVGELEAQLVDMGPAVGRIQDTFNPTIQGEVDFANSIGQLYAAQGLDAAGSPAAGAATGFLIAQQCDEGFFRQDFAPLDAAEQDCDADAGAQPSTDVTALAVLALLPQADVAGVQAAIDAAVAWLVDAQADNGSFGAGPDIPAPNSNSTGLAGWALGEVGTEASLAAAERAAAYVRAFQVDEVAPCNTALADSEGAIAYDGAALTAGRKDGITVPLQDQWRRASVQALPALRWAPSAPIDPPSITDPPVRYFHPGERVTLHADVQVPGDTVCFFLGQRLRALAPVLADGSASFTTKLPAGTATRRYWFSTDEVEKSFAGRYQVLGAAKLRLELKREVARGGTQVVKVRGLAEGERFRAIFRGARVDAGRANAKGRAVARFAVGKTTGPVRVLVLGEFKNRRASRAFTITR